MSNTYRKAGTTVGGAFRASILAGAAMTLAMVSVAQESAPEQPDAAASAPEVSVEGSGRPVGVISTNPLEINQQPGPAEAAASTAPVATAVGPEAMKALLNGPSREAAAPTLESVPWALTPETRPWPLRAAMSVSIPGLVLSLPASKDLRIMLPGVIDDRISHLNFVIAKYQTDIASSVAMAQGRADQEFSVWTKALQEQSKKIDKLDPWQNYQFALELRAITKAYKAEYLKLSESISPQIQQQFTKAVDSITQVMNETEGHNQQMGWYNLLVQLKDGFTVLQQNILETNEAYVEKIGEIEKQFPLLPMPDTPKPLTEEQRIAKQRADMQLAAVAAPEQASPAARQKAQELQVPGESSYGGVIAVLVGLFTAIGGFFMLRKRKAQAPAASK